MFRHILFATDGSPASHGALHQCIAFARDAGARVTGIHVVPKFHLIGYQSAMVVDSRAEAEEKHATLARRYLAEVEIAAREQGVPCETLSLPHEHPYEAIIEVARERGCDLICVASHGVTGMQGVLLGSETQKILNHSSLPVLVYR